jgi:hypothetical protein
MLVMVSRLWGRVVPNVGRECVEQLQRLVARACESPISAEGSEQVWIPKVNKASIASGHLAFRCHGKFYKDDRAEHIPSIEINK